jgi:hypothetical protein
MMGRQWVTKKGEQKRGQRVGFGKCVRPSAVRLAAERHFDIEDAFVSTSDVDWGNRALSASPVFNPPESHLCDVDDCGRCGAALKENGGSTAFDSTKATKEG